MNSTIGNNSREKHSEKDISEDELSQEESDVHLCHWCHRIEEENENFSIIDFSEEEKEKKFYCCSIEHEQKISSFYSYLEKIRLVFYGFVLLIPLVLLVLLVILRHHQSLHILTLAGLLL